MQKYFGKLPGTPSNLIRLALEDLEKVRKDSRYEIDMNQWHSPNIYNSRCSVCLGGNVIAKSLDTYSIYHAPHDFPKESLALKALDNFRQGYLCEGLRDLGIYKNVPDADHIVEYSEDPEEFINQMHFIADYFEYIGL